MLEVNGRQLRARAHTDGSRVEGLALLGLDLEAVPGKGESMSDDVIGCFAVAFRLCCNPGSLELLLGFFGRLHDSSPVERGAMSPDLFSGNPITGIAITRLMHGSR